jgi:2-aminoadipate transaminase
MTRALSNPELISLAAGFVDQPTLPYEATKRAFEALWADEKTARQSLQYGSNDGYLPLRETLLARLSQYDGHTYDDVSVDQMMITSGSNQLLHLLSDSLIDPGDYVICSAPTYFVYMGILQDIGARAYGVEMDDNGMIPESLEAALEQLDAAGELHRVKAIYLVSYFDNPSAMTTSLERRHQIVDIAQRYSREHRIYVIEDAAYRELRFGVADIPSTFSCDEQHETVIYTATFSKSFSPGIRVGWGIFPRELQKTISNLKGNIDFGSPNFSQQLIYQMIQLDLFDDHIHSLQQNYARKCKAMVDAAEKYLRPIDGVDWFEPNGGLYLWLKLPEHIAAGGDGPLFDMAVSKGMLYVPGEYCFPEEGVGIKKNTIRISFGVQDSPEIERGVQLLAEAITELI